MNTELKNNTGTSRKIVKPLFMAIFALHALITLGLTTLINFPAVLETGFKRQM